MIGSVLVLVMSVVLFVYWFRYTCLLMLEAKPAVDRTGEVAAAHGLSLPDVLVRLREQAGDGQLATLRESLDRDYRVLAGLLRGAAEFQAGGCPLEDRLLMIDYAIMRVWYSAARRFSHSRAQQAVAEMAGIVSHFAGVVGGLTAARSEI